MVGLPSVSTLTDTIAMLLPEPHAGLLSAITFGTKQTMSRELYGALVATGTLHIAALSGSNIAILTGTTGFILLQWAKRGLAQVLTILLIIGFVLFVGPSPSIVRAAIMGSVALLSAAFGRQSWSLWGWVIAAASMIVFSPDMLTNLSFQLSAMASLGMILFGQGERKNFPSEQSVFKRIVDGCRDEFRTTMAAQVFTVPIMVFSFHRVSLISPIANILLAPVIPLITVSGIFLPLLAYLWHPLAVVASWGVWVFLAYLINVVRVLAAIPFASISW